MYAILKNEFQETRLWILWEIFTPKSSLLYNSSQPSFQPASRFTFPNATLYIFYLLEYIHQPLSLKFMFSPSLKQTFGADIPLLFFSGAILATIPVAFTVGGKSV